MSQISNRTPGPDTVTSAMIVDLEIVNADISASAAVAWSKMANLTASTMLYSNASGDVTATAAPTDGQLLIGSTGLIPALAALTGTANQVTVTNGAGSITLATPQSIATTSDVTFGSATLAKAAKALDVQNTTDAASNQVGVLGSGNRAVPAANDEGYLTLKNDDDLGAQVEFARITWRATDVVNTTKDAAIRLDAMVANTLTNLFILDGSGLSIASGDAFQIAGTSVLNATTLGSGVTASSLTSVGTITTGVWTGTTIVVANGGTGATTLTDGGFLFGNGTGAVVASANPTNGQLAIGSTGVDPVIAALTAGTGMTITNGAGTITLASVAGGMSYTEVTGTSQAAAVNNAYLANNVALVTVTLPTTAAVGDMVSVEGKGAGGWRVAQNAGQLIHTSTADTTTGVGGRLDSTNRYNCVALRCTTANTDWLMVTATGAITIT